MAYVQLHTRTYNTEQIRIQNLKLYILFLAHNNGIFTILQGWEFAHSLSAHLLIRS